MVFKIYSKPQDRSLKAFKEWFEGYHPPRLKSTDEVRTRYWIDEEQWVADWKRFWAKVDGPSNRQGPANG